MPTVTGKIKLDATSSGFTLVIVTTTTNPTPPPPTIETETEFNDLPAWVKDVVKGNAGATADVTHDGATPPAITRVVVRA